MSSTIRQHAGATLVAAGVIAASLFEGSFQPSAYAVASVVIWAAVLSGLLSRTLPASPVAGPAIGAGLCFTGVVILAGASVAWASDQGKAFEEAVRASTYLGLFALAACTASPGGRAEWIAGLAAGLGAVSALAVLSWLQPGLLEDGSQLELAAGVDARLSHPVGYWNGLGALLAITVILLAHGGANAPERKLRALSVAAIPIPLLGLWFTTSRGAGIALALGVIALVLASPSRPRQLLVASVGIVTGGIGVLAASRMRSLSDGIGDSAARAEGDWMLVILIALVAASGSAIWLLDRVEWRPRAPRGVWRLVAALVAAGAAILLLAAVIAADPVDRFRELREPPPPSETAGFTAAGAGKVSGNGRWQLWDGAVDAFREAPVAGLGAGGYEDWWSQHATISLFARDAHSLPLQQLAELGMLGAGLLLGFIAAVAVGARRWLAEGRDRDAAVLIAVACAGALAAAIDWSWSIPAVFAPVAVAAGLLAASAPGTEPRRDAYALGLATVAMAWVAMMSAGLVALTEVKLRQSRSAAAEGRLGDAIARADEATTVQPWSPEPYTQLALLEEERGNLDEALSRLEQARARDSEDWRIAFLEVRLHGERGDGEALRLAFERARELNPRAGYLGGG